MSDQFDINAQVREDMGKGASRRLRRLADLVPGILYGGDKDPMPLSLVRKDLEKSMENEAFFSQILNLHIDSGQEKAILKDLQRHPARNSVLHADFMRINENEPLKVNVPIHFINETTCKGVKLQGGVIQHQVTDIEILCLPADIPAYIEVDMADMEIGQIVHLSEIPLPEGVTSVALSLGEDHDLAVASVFEPRVAEVEEGEEAAAVDDSDEEAGEDDDKDDSED